MRSRFIYNISAMSWRCRGRYYSRIVTISEYPMGQVLLGFSGECWEIFKRNFFTEHLWTTACEEYYFTRVLCSKTLRKGIWHIFKAYRIIVQISLMNFRSCLGLLRIVPLDFSHQDGIKIVPPCLLIRPVSHIKSL